MVIKQMMVARFSVNMIKNDSLHEVIAIKPQDTFSRYF